MNKQERIHQLLEENKEILLNGATDNGLCYDGIINEAIYKQQISNLAFLLKETNGNDKNGDLPTKLNDWEYADWLQKYQASGKESLYKTFFNVCMWISEFYDIFETGSTFVEKYFKNGSLQINNELSQNLNKIALINLKKTWGRGTSSWKEINSYINRPEIKKVLQTEIEIASPTVVLCGGKEVFDFAIRIFGSKDSRIETIMTPSCNNVDYFRSINTVYVSFRHPSSRYSRENQFMFAKDIFIALKTIL